MTNRISEVKPGEVPLAVAKFLARTVALKNGCINWAGPKAPSGYGCVYFLGRMQRPHRVAWFIVRKSWPVYTIDHLCRNKLCVNVAHMRDVPVDVNVRSANARPICKRGHHRTPENYYRSAGSGKARCRACARSRKRERRARSW